jgi:hypothetical protein
VPDAKFVSFTAKEDPPQVDPTPAKISAIQAGNAFKQEFDSVIAPHWLTNHHMKMTYSKLGTPVLGYFLPPGQTVARLVWSVPYRLYRRWDDGATMGFGATFIDAVTGKWIPREGEL